MTTARSKKTETFVSFLLLIALAVIVTAVLIKQSDFSPADFNVDLPAALASSGSTAVDLGRLLPAGFTNMTPLEHFDAETLYVKINGKAELYLPAGFAELTTLRFVSTTDENLWAEIYLYDMAAPTGAFSVFSAQRRLDVDNLSITRFAYRSQNAVFFTKGKYYIEIVASAKNDILDKAILDTAGNIIDALPSEDQAPPELDLFAKENLIEQSYKLITTDAFGFSGFNNVFIAKYSMDGQAITAFISKQKNPTQLVKAYCDFLIDNGANDKSSSAYPTRVLDFYGTTEIVGVVSSYVYGVHEADDLQAAKKIALMLDSSIAKKFRR
jgi:Family of unknown function (DUF6599)